MDPAQWLTIGVSIVQILVVPVGCFRYILGVEKRLTRIEAKLGIAD
ncbi:hypothetical protein [Burkholderia cepacia]|nr:hypothetical protein [Burkholderia cepacia]